MNISKKTQRCETMLIFLLVIKILVPVFFLPCNLLSCAISFVLRLEAPTVLIFFLSKLILVRSNTSKLFQVSKCNLLVGDGMYIGHADNAHKLVLVFHTVKG